jgi:hypothetical protein
MVYNTQNYWVFRLFQWVPGPISLEVKRQERKADDSPPASAEVKKIGSIHPLLHAPSLPSANSLSTRTTLSYRYSRKQKTCSFGNLICFRPQVGEDNYSVGSLRKG